MFLYVKHQLKEEKMAIPIGATPILKGKEADRFIQQVNESEKHPIRFVATPKLAKARQMVREYSEREKKRNI
jgi:hypothetical protein